jgi:hypothetical protein
MLANWSRQRFWDSVVSTQRDFFKPFLFLLSSKKGFFCKKILIFHAVRLFQRWQGFGVGRIASMRAKLQECPDGAVSENLFPTRFISAGDRAAGAWEERCPEGKSRRLP